MSNQVMVDIETLSVRPDAAIVTIGAVKFSRKGPLKSLEDSDTFYRRIDLDSLQGKSFRIEEYTLNWWDTQDPAIRHEALYHPDRHPLENVLSEFTAWYGDAYQIWANGDDFDCVILEHAYRQFDMTPPWRFWQTRDLRTLYDLGQIRKDDLPNNSAHNALHDAYNQVIGARRALKNLGL